jgi:hypothetical protein
VTPEQNMLDIHLTEIKNGHEIYIRRVPEAGDSARTKLIESIHFMQQKLDYIHTNPLRTKIPLVVDSIDYVHSSALQYDKGIYYHCEVIPVQKMLDINLTGIKYGLE